MSVTIRDVARAAGVSVKTVSRVINNERWVRDDTRARVEQAISDLGFHPNPLARGLNTNRMHSLGLIVPDIANPFFARGIDGCATVAARHGYNLFLGSASDTRGREIAHIEALLVQRVSGLILWVSGLTDAALHEVMQRMKHHCPAVFVDRPFDPASLERLGYAAILVAQEDVGRLATDHLLAEGRRQIAHIGLTASRPGGWVGEQRLAGYYHALRAGSVPIDERLIYRVPHATIRAGVLAARALLAQHPRPDALFAFNDLLAVGALLACQDAGVRVPDDMAIVGVDDTEMAAVTQPPLTTIRLHQRETGARAAELLLALMGAQARSVPASPEARAPAGPPPPELVVRRSSTMRPVAATPLDDILREGDDDHM